MSDEAEVLFGRGGLALPLTSNLFLLKRPMIVGTRRRIGRMREMVQRDGREMGREAIVRRS